MGSDPPLHLFACPGGVLTTPPSQKGRVSAWSAAQTGSGGSPRGKWLRPARTSISAAPMRTVALIPARGGSKGIARKNVRLLCGKPLLQYTADAALGARRLDRIILSTDDEEI